MVRVRKVRVARNPHHITREFEGELCRYTGSPYAVAVSSCTMALLLAVRWCVINRDFELDDMPSIGIPKRTYVSVPMSIIHAGGRVVFRDEEWLGTYQLKPLPVWDSARFLTGGMYVRGQMQCLSFHWTKTLGMKYHQGGAILHDDPEADKWLRRARFDGRTEGVLPKDDVFDMIGWHCYMDPCTARELWRKLKFLPLKNEPIPNDEYADLSLHEAFR